MNETEGKRQQDSQKGRLQHLIRMTATNDKQGDAGNMVPYNIRNESLSCPDEAYYYTFKRLQGMSPYSVLCGGFLVDILICVGRRSCIVLYYCKVLF